MSAKAEPKFPKLDEDILDRVSNGRYFDPHSVLGVHPVDGGWVIRSLRPLAKTVTAILGKQTVELAHSFNGIFEGVVTQKTKPKYQIHATYEEGEWLSDDSYSFAPTIGELDLHLIAEGRHEQLWQALGANLRNGGVAFAVWAPNAQAVRVVGDFNGWNGTTHAMRVMGSSGVWELFVPGLNAGTKYKFEILTKAGNWITKIDPLAKFAEIPPSTASVVTTSTYQWKDQNWLEARSKRDALSSPMSIYELHVGSWKSGLNYRSLAEELIPYITQLGFTHVEFLPIMEHPYAPSWGYQVTGYYAPTSRFGSPDDLKFLIDQLHQAGIGVILDWVPAHFPKDEWALGRFDGEPLYEHSDPRRGEHPDWGTFIFNFGRTEVRNFLVANALYWLEEFHVDGLRVDAVASMLYLDYSREGNDWLPNVHGGRENLEAIAFMQEVNATAYRRNPGIMMIAEESTSWGGVSAPTDGGGLGYGFKWNMGWMNDSLKYIEKDPMYRSHHHGEITFSMLYAYDEKFILPISHDEVVHGKGSLLAKMPGDRWQQLANVRAYLAFMWSHPGKQLLFMGCELGQLTEWNQEAGLDWSGLQDPARASLQAYVATLNRIYGTTPALWQRDHQQAGFQWVDGGNASQQVLTFLRFDANGNPLACVINFAGTPHHDFQLGLPTPGVWEEILNSDAVEFGGSGVGNLGQINADGPESHGQPVSAKIQVPPLGAVWFRPRPSK